MKGIKSFSTRILSSSKEGSTSSPRPLKSRDLGGQEAWEADDDPASTPKHQNVKKLDTKMLHEQGSSTSDGVPISPIRPAGHVPPSNVFPTRKGAKVTVVTPPAAVESVTQQQQPRSFKESSAADSSSLEARRSSRSVFQKSSSSPSLPAAVHDADRHKPRKSKMEKIRELQEENKKLKTSSRQLHLDLEAKERQIENLSVSSNEQQQPPLAKHVEAMQALTSVTKKQQECLAAYQERDKELAKECEYFQGEAKRVQKELSKKRKEASMLEKQIDANLEEITGLRKELSHATQQIQSLEQGHKEDRGKLIDLTRDLALTKAGRSDAPDDVKAIADRIEIFQEELLDKDNEIEEQRQELSNQKEQIQRLYADLERTHEQVAQYERERDATVADMETYYEALKHELEEKSKLLETAEQDKEAIERETRQTVLTLQSRCDQLSSDLLEADEELARLRREQDPWNASSPTEAPRAKEEFEEERQRINASLASVTEELEETKKRYADMGIEHANAYQSLEEEVGGIKLELTEARTALQEANARSESLTTKNERLEVENRSLLEISQDLQSKLRDEQAREERNASAEKNLSDDNSSTGSGDEQPKTAESGVLVPKSTSSKSRSLTLDTVHEDSEDSDRDSANDADSVRESANDSSTASSDDAVDDPQTSPASSVGSGPPEASTQQELLLQAAADRKLQKAKSEKTKSWRSMKLVKNLQSRSQSSLASSQNRSSSPLPPLAGSEKSGSSSAGLDDADKDQLIESLRKRNDEHEETITRLKSELVRVNAFYKDAAYMSNRKVESLTQENSAYEIKIVVLEKMLEKLGGSADELTHISENSEGGSEGESQAVETTSQDEVTPQRDWSSPPKFLDRIKELEGQVNDLERQKSFAEAKMKAVESDLESFQRTSKQATMDSLLEIERLKIENADQARQLTLLQNQSDDDGDGGDNGAVIERV